MRAFEFSGRVPTRISDDNSKVAVGKIVGNREREVTKEFLETEKSLFAGRSLLSGAILLILEYQQEPAIDLFCLDGRSDEEERLHAALHALWSGDHRRAD